MKSSRVFIAVTALALATVAAAGPAPFYVSMLDRGISDVTHGNYKDGVQELRVAAFGFVNDIPRYETAQVYIAIACTKMKNSDDARIAMTKLLNAERIAPAYAKLNLNPAVRAQFDDALPALLTPAEVALLKPQPKVIVVAAVIPRGGQAPPPVPSVLKPRTGEAPVLRRETPKVAVVAVAAPAPKPVRIPVPVPPTMTSASAKPATAKSVVPAPSLSQPARTLSVEPTAVSPLVAAAKHKPSEANLSEPKPERKIESEKP